MKLEMRSISRTAFEIFALGRKSLSFGAMERAGTTTCGAPLGSGGNTRLLEGYRKSIDALRNVTDSAKAHEKLEEIAAQHPQIRVLGTVEVLPQFLDRLRQSEQLADVLAELQPTPGTKTMPSPAARVVDVMQVVTLALDDPQMRVAAGSVAGLAARILGNIYEDISNKYYGDAGPTKTEDLMWTVGTTLEVLGKILKSGKAPEMKGKVNV